MTVYMPARTTLAPTPSFADRVYRIVAAIPVGSVLTYKDVATMAGRPRAYRAVGNILNKNYNPQIPCHRVVRSDGQPGGYNRGRRRKQNLLRQEGVKSKKVV